MGCTLGIGGEGVGIIAFSTFQYYIFDDVADLKLLHCRSTPTWNETSDQTLKVVYLLEFLVPSPQTAIEVKSGC